MLLNIEMIGLWIFIDGSNPQPHNTNNIERQAVGVFWTMNVVTPRKLMHTKSGKLGYDNILQHSLKSIDLNRKCQVIFICSPPPMIILMGVWMDARNSLAVIIWMRGRCEHLCRINQGNINSHLRNDVDGFTHLSTSAHLCQSVFQWMTHHLCVFICLCWSIWNPHSAQFSFSEHT